MIPSIPAKYSTQQFSRFVTLSERIAPPNHALCLLANTVLTVTCYRAKVIPTEKLRYLLAAIGLGVGVIVYSESVTIPLNMKLLDCDRKLQEGASEAAMKDEVRSQLDRWQKGNLGERSNTSEAQ